MSSVNEPPPHDPEWSAEKFSRGNEASLSSLGFTVNPLMRLLLPHFKAKAAGNQMNEGSVKIVESHHDKQDDMMCWH